MWQAEWWHAIAFNEISKVISQQFERLSDLEKQLHEEIETENLDKFLSLSLIKAQAGEWQPRWDDLALGCEHKGVPKNNKSRSPLWKDEYYRGYGFNRSTKSYPQSTGGYWGRLSDRVKHTARGDRLILVFLDTFEVGDELAERW